MRSKVIQTAFLLLALPALVVVSRAQTDVAASVYGAFTGTTTGNGVQQSPSNAAGGLFELRHIRNPLIGFEATYAYNRANQVYGISGFAPAASSCPVGVICPPPPAIVSANAHEVTGDWVASIKVGHLRPFALAGVGLLLDVPAGGQSNTTTTAKPVYVYGGGIDWGLLPHIGLRFQYRGNLYNAPDLTSLYTSTDRFTHTAEPMIGGYFRF
jgi:opacity protein-like surface antigen